MGSSNIGCGCVIFCVACSEWSGMPHIQQNDLVLLIFLFPMHTVQWNKSLPESLNKRILAISSSSKLPTLESSCSFFSTLQCSSLSLPHFDSHCSQEKGIPFDTNSYVKALRKWFQNGGTNTICWFKWKRHSKTPNRKCCVGCFHSVLLFNGRWIWELRKKNNPCPIIVGYRSEHVKLVAVDAFINVQSAILETVHSDIFTQFAGNEKTLWSARTPYCVSRCSLLHEIWKFSSMSSYMLHAVLFLTKDSGP